MCCPSRTAKNLCLKPFFKASFTQPLLNTSPVTNLNEVGAALVANYYLSECCSINIIKCVRLQLSVNFWKSRITIAVGDLILTRAPSHHLAAVTDITSRDL